MVLGHAEDARVLQAAMAALLAAQEVRTDYDIAKASTQGRRRCLYTDHAPLEFEADKSVFLF